MDNNRSELNEIADAMETSGMTRRYRFIDNAVRHFRQTGNPHFLKEAIRKYPGIINKAVAIANSDNPFLPAPEGDELALLQGLLKVGIVNERGFMAGINPDELTSGMNSLGRIGGGKSYAILRLIAQMLDIPREVRGFNLLIIQTQKNDADFLIKTHPLLRIINRPNFRRSPLYVEDWDTKDSKINSFCPIFSNTNWLLSISQPLFKRCVELAFAKCTANNPKAIPNFSDIAAQIEPASIQLELKGNEHRNTKDKLRSVLQPFIESKEIYNCKAGLTISEFFSKEDIILNLKEEPSDYALSTIVSDILIGLQRYYEKYPGEHGKLRTLVIIDESRRLFPAKEGNTDHNPHVHMERFVTTRRANGIGMIVISQEPESMRRWLSNTAAFTIIFPITGESRDKAQKILNLRDVQAEYLDSLKKQGMGIMRYQGFPRRFIIEIPGDLDAYLIPEIETDAIMADYIKSMHDNLKRQTEAMETKQPEIEKKDEPFTMSRTSIDAMTILNMLDRRPFMHKTSLRKNYLNDDSQRMDKASKWLIENHYVAELKGVTIDGGWAKYLALTDKAHETLKKPHKRRIAEQRFLHTMYCGRIANWLKKAGRKPQREYATPFGFIDVFVQHGAKKTAYEMEKTIDPRQLTANIRKCLNSKMDEIVLVVEGAKGDLDSLRTILADIPISQAEMEKISYTAIKDLKSIILGKENNPLPGESEEYEEQMEM